MTSGQCYQTSIIASERDMLREIESNTIIHKDLSFQCAQETNAAQTLINEGQCSTTRPCVFLLPREQEPICPVMMSFMLMTQRAMTLIPNANAMQSHSLPIRRQVACVCSHNQTLPIILPFPRPALFLLYRGFLFLRQHRVSRSRLARRLERLRRVFATGVTRQILCLACDRPFLPGS